MKKIIDDKGRLFGLLSFIDVVVAAVVIILAIAVFVKFRVNNNPLTSSNSVAVSYTVKISTIRDTNVKHLRPGDKLYAAEVNTLIGTIKDVEVTDAKSIESLPNGTYVEANVEGYYDVLLTVETMCSFSNGRYYIDRTFELNANSELWMYTKYNDIRGILMSIAAE